MNLRIPPLRDRRDDVPVLAQYFLERNQRETGVTHEFSDDALRAMMSYDWPGNVRELETAIERACALSSGPTLHMGDLPTQLHTFRQHSRLASEADSDSDSGGPSEASEGRNVSGVIVSIAEMERQAILGTIRQLKATS